MGEVMRISGQSFNPGKLHLIRSDAIGKSTESIVARIWRFIVDCFCGSNHSEAECCLKILYSLSQSDDSKIKCFYRLQELADEKFKHRFSVIDLEEINTEKEDLSKAKNEGPDIRWSTVYQFSMREYPDLNWSLVKMCEVICDESLSRKRIQGELNDMRGLESQYDTALRDCPFDTIVACNTWIKRGADGDFSHEERRLETILDLVKGNAPQKRSMKLLCGNRLFTSIIEALESSRGQSLDHSQVEKGLRQAAPRIEFDRTGAGVLRATVSFSTDLADAKNAAAFGAVCMLFRGPIERVKSLEFEFVASVADDGQITVERMNYLVNRGKKLDEADSDREVDSMLDT